MKKGTRFYRQNKVFKTDAKKFYRGMGKQPIEIKEPPSINEVDKFWKKIGSNEKEHNEEAEWIKREEEKMKETEQQEWENIELK